MVVSTVVITTYLDDGRLDLTLQGFARQKGCKDFEVIVVDDGSPNWTSHDLVLRHRFRPIYLAPPSTDFRLAAARNVGLTNASGSQVIICDCDTIPAEDFIAKHQAHPYSVNIGLRKRISIENSERLLGKTIPSQEDLENLCYTDDDRITGNRSEEFSALREHNNVRPWSICWGCNFSAPACSMRSLGGFDAGFVGWGGEDEDMAERLYRVGLPFTALPKCYVYHLDHPGRTSQRADIRRLGGPLVRNGGPITPASFNVETL